MSTFQSLMKKAAAHTQELSGKAAELKAQREASIRKARLEQEERDAKEREHRKMTLMREIEARKKAEADRLRKEEEALKREQDKERKAHEVPLPFVRAVQQLQNSGKARSASPRSGITSPSSSSTALTREEKRALADPLFRDTVTRTKPSTSHAKKNGRLPGGALSRMATVSSPNASSSSSMTARERIAASFRNLTPLNTVKKDMRTIDEITRDLEKGRLGGHAATEKAELTGVEAATFTDWFPKSKKEREKEAAAAREQQAKRAELARKQTGANQRAAPTPSSSNSRAPKGFTDPSLKSFSSGHVRPSKPVSTSSRLQPKSSNPPSQVKSSSQTSTAQSSRTSTNATQRKRPRDLPEDPSDSELESDSSHYNSTPSNRRPAKKPRGSGGGYVPGSIAAMFGRDLSRDRERDIMSDDEDDMEARDYAAIMREEAASAKIARREDALAEAEEKRREAEKRKRRAEKEKRGN